MVSKSRERERRWRRCTAAGRRPLRGEALPAARAPPFQDGAAGLRRHPLAEAMPTLPSTHVGLIGLFHDSSERMKLGVARWAPGSIERQSRISFPQPERATPPVETPCESRVFP